MIIIAGGSSTATGADVSVAAPHDSEDEREILENGEQQEQQQQQQHYNNSARVNGLTAHGIEILAPEDHGGGTELELSPQRPMSGGPTLLPDTFPGLPDSLLVNGHLAMDSNGDEPTVNELHQECVTNHDDAADDDGDDDPLLAGTFGARRECLFTDRSQVKSRL